MKPRRLRRSSSFARLDYEVLPAYFTAKAMAPGVVAIHAETKQRCAKCTMSLAMRKQVLPPPRQIWPEKTYHFAEVNHAHIRAQRDTLVEHDFSPSAVT